MPVRTKVLADGFVSTGAIASLVLYTVPVGKTAIVKNIAVWNLLSRTLTLKTRASPTSGGIPFWTVTPGTNASSRLETWIVLGPGYTLELDATGTNDYVSWHVSGAQLDGVAP